MKYQPIIPENETPEEKEERQLFELETIKSIANNVFPPGSNNELYGNILRSLVSQIDDLRTQLHNEQHDVHMLADHCSKIYYYTSHGLISKPNTHPEEVMEIAEQFRDSYIERGHDIIQRIAQRCDLPQDLKDEVDNWVSDA